MQGLLLALGLDTLADDAQLQGMGEADDGADDRVTLPAALVVVEPSDERLVDLDRVDREAGQVRQRRVAGPEVVEGEGHAELVQRSDGLVRAVRLVEQRGLGELEAQPLGRQPGRRELVGDPSGEVLVAELVRREVDPHRRWLSAGPGGGLPDRLRQHPVAQRADQPGLLRQWQEQRGGEQPAGRVLPSHECLHADDRSAREAHLRLVVQAQLSGADARTQVLLKLEAGHGANPQGAVEHLEARPPEVLRRVHRRIGVAQQLAGAVAAPIGEGDADRGGDHEVGRADGDR